MPIQTRATVNVIDYDFNGMGNAYEWIWEYYNDPNKKEALHEGLISLKNELNRFFKDSVCDEIIYTNNVDKMFFGMCVMPSIKSEDVYKYVQGDEELRIDHYSLELDSKLFNAGITSEEFVAILLHEIGHIVNDASSVNRFKKNMANYMCTNGPLRVTSNINYREILTFGIKDSLRKMDSIFDKRDDEILADEFVISYGYGQYLDSALRKIVKYTGNIPKVDGNKFLVMAWTMRLYNDILNRRIPALYQIRKMVDIVPSYFEKSELKNLEIRLRRIDDDSILGNYIQEGGFIAGLKRKGIKSYEEDFYELTMLTKNVQTEDDALVIMHRINSRISIIEDYIDSEEPNKNDDKRWNLLLDKYRKLRDILSSKTLMKDDYSRINVVYPTIRDQTTV